MALTKVAAAGIAADSIDETKLADNSIDSEHYNDGSIDNAHLADDAVGVAELSATGTASTETFLRGDNSWATPAIKTTEEVQDIVGAMFTGNTETNITATYEDSDGTIDLVSTDTNTQLSTEEVQDIVGAMFTGNTETNITATYEDSDGTIDLVGSSGVGGATGVDFNDDVKIRSGTGNDLSIYHDGTDSRIDNITGNLILRVATDEKAIACVPNGGVELYHDNVKKFETNNDGVAFDNDATNMSIYLKANNALKGYVFAGPGDEIGFKTASNEWAVQVDSDAEVALYYDGTAMFQTASYGTLQNNGNFRLMDGTDADAGWGRVQWGQSQDLEIYHNATDSMIKNSTNSLKIDSGRTIIRNLSNGDPMVDCSGGGAVELFHNGTKKLETSSAGGTLTGAWTGAGKVLQVVSTVKTDLWSEDLANATYSSVVSGLTVDITPSSASNKVLVQVVVAVSQEQYDRVGVSLTRGGSVIVASLGAGTGNRIGVGSTNGNPSSTQASSTPIVYLDSPSSTSSLTYGIKVMQGSGSTGEVIINGQATDDSASANRFRYSSTITAMEISA